MRITPHARGLRAMLIHNIAVAAGRCASTPKDSRAKDDDREKVWRALQAALNGWEAMTIALNDTGRANNITFALGGLATDEREDYEKAKHLINVLGLLYGPREGSA